MLTSKYVHITTHFKELKGSECLCGASELSMNKKGCEPFLEGLRVDILCTQLYYICFFEF